MADTSGRDTSGTAESGTSVRQRLVSAAAEVFAEEGFDRARVQDIARRAGLSTGAIYGNFRDKSQLLAEAVDSGMDEVVRAMEAARQEGASALDLLELMGRHLADPSGTRRRLLMTEALAAARRDDSVRARVLDSVARTEADLARVVERARRDGRVLPGLATDAVVRFSVCLALGYHQLVGAGAPAPDPGSWGRLIHHLTLSLGADQAELAQGSR